MVKSLFPTAALSTKVEEALSNGKVLPVLQITKSFWKTEQKRLSAEQKLEATRLWLRLYHGKTIGRWTVISDMVIRPGSRALCRCECGFESLVSVRNIISGRSGGCKRCSSHRRMIAPSKRISKSLGNRWNNIQQRCTNPEHKHYRLYGGRGIQNRFSSRTEFIRWVQENLPHPTYDRSVEIDRIDNDSHYEPGNLRLATRKQQCNNRAVTVRIDGIPLSEFYEKHRRLACRDTFWQLARRGMSEQQILDHLRNRKGKKRR